MGDSAKDPPKHSQAITHGYLEFGVNLSAATVC
jgi:hypothetical protein